MQMNQNFLDDRPLIELAREALIEKNFQQCRNLIITFLSYSNDLQDNNI
jgi:hypothetical protein